MPKEWGNYVGFEFLTTVVMKCAIFRDITPFRRNRALHATFFHAGIVFGLFIEPKDAGDKFLRNVG
jgi:hypothetical protein